jgi:HK97 family phage major capsid protein
MSATQLEQTGRELYELRQENLRLFSKKKDGQYDWDDADRARFRELNGEPAAAGKPEVKGKLGELHDRYKELEYLVNAESANGRAIDELKRPASGAPIHPPGPQTGEARRRSVAEAFGESAAFKAYREGGLNGQCKVELPGYWAGDLDRKMALGAAAEFKTTMTEAAGFAPFVYRTGDVVGFPLRRPVVQDLMPSIRTDGPAIKYMEETTFTRAAAGVSEGGTKPETARAWTERTVLVEVIACVLPVTEQQLMDVPQIMGLITASLGTEIALAEEDAVLNGNGTSPQLQGFLTKTGVQTAAAGTSPLETAIFNAFTQVRFTGFAEPSAVVINPTDWQTVVTHQATTGFYIYGPPQETVAQRVWGVPTVVTPAMAQGTALIGDFATYAYVVRRMELTIAVGWINDNFTKNLRTIRAESRLGLVIRRPSAFATITSITSSN